ncbi:MAG: Smr/MutS family protein [Lactobacillaceae bacterium]|jgi:DNA-nicking Smr family endonuclease|nr:Smr/MutS family protein [Lactobacillaceae bacterium]
MNQKSEDEKLWKEYTKGIKKIESENTVFKDTNKELKVKKHIQTPNISISKNQESLELGSFDNVDKNTAKKFRRGEMGIEATLDLHGFTEDMAYDAVINFIKNSYSYGKRSVIIITGKGIRKTDDDIFLSKGILKERVPRWLNSDELRPFILSYIHPDAKLGGEGALQILLRRKR